MVLNSEYTLMDTDTHSNGYCLVLEPLLFSVIAVTKEAAAGHDNLPEHCITRLDC